MRDRRPEGAIADDDPRLVGELHWHSTWMPFVTAGNVCLLVDTSDARPDGSAPARVLLWDWDQWDVDQAPSLTEVVKVWLRVLREGYYWWDERERRWMDRFAELPPDVNRAILA